jgi:hypothetical protein
LKLVLQLQVLLFQVFFSLLVAQVRSISLQILLFQCYVIPVYKGKSLICKTFATINANVW